jgi:3-oxoacyl-[acyl-carrier-protein] synthase II
MGTVNPLAVTVDSFWKALLACQSGIRRIQRFDSSAFTCHIGGEVLGFDGVPASYMDGRESKRMDRFAQFAVTAAIDAVRDSGLDFPHEAPDRCGVVVGSGIGGLLELEEQHNRLLEKGPGRVSPFTVPRLMINAAAGTISIQWGLRGPNSAVVTACASASNAIGEAMRTIQRDEADVMITGGSEAALTPLGLASFCALKGLSLRNDDPEHASRPFDKDRDGFVLSEGSGIVVVEELEHARKRGARIDGELVGYGASGDGYHITAPDPEGKGASAAMRRALKDAGLAPDQVQYVNAHGTGTDLGDVAETGAVKQVFGDWAKNGLVISSTKSSHGHLLGASGGVELIASILAIRDGVIPPTLNLEHADERCDLDYAPLKPREMKVDAALSNSFGFGGHNACILVRKFNG